VWTNLGTTEKSVFHWEQLKGSGTTKGVKSLLLTKCHCQVKYVNFEDLTPLLCILKSSSRKNGKWRADPSSFFFILSLFFEIWRRDPYSFPTLILFQDNHSCCCLVKELGLEMTSYGPSLFRNRLVRTRMPGGVEAGGEKPPAIRLDSLFSRQYLPLARNFPFKTIKL
jgi:hypothetical protein